MNNSILKQETADLHMLTEKIMQSNLLFSGQFTVSHYKNFILKSYNYIAGINSKVSLDWPEFSDILTKKVNALNADLKHLNLLPAKSALFIPNNERFYNLGLIYIVLGAMLGNKIILHKLQKSALFKDFPFFYLSLHQEILPVIWKNFQSKINELNQQELEKVIQGARDGYLLFAK